MTGGKKIIFHQEHIYFQILIMIIFTVILIYIMKKKVIQKYIENISCPKEKYLTNYQKTILL